MDLLDTPLEALVFSDTVTAASSLWTWLAVFTAAVGFWRIRAVASLLLPPHLTSREPQQPTASTSPPPEQRPEEAQPCHPEPNTTVFSEARKVEDKPECQMGIYRKGVIFDFCEAEEEGVAGEGEESGVLDNERFLDGGENGICWEEERMKVLWKGDLGWYRFQDRAVINGSIVKLWDDDRWLASPPCSSGFAVAVGAGVEWERWKDATEIVNSPFSMRRAA